MSADCEVTQILSYERSICKWGTNFCAHAELLIINYILAHRLAILPQYRGSSEHAVGSEDWRGFRQQHQGCGWCYGALKQAHRRRAFGQCCQRPRLCLPHPPSLWSQSMSLQVQFRCPLSQTHWLCRAFPISPQGFRAVPLSNHQVHREGSSCSLADSALNTGLPGEVQKRWTLH